MDRETVNAICATLPGAEVSDPWGGGHDAWKVGGKLFAVVGAENRGVSVKCADIETAQMLIDAGQGVKAPYFHRSWILVPWEGCTPSDLAHRIESSYAMIRKGLPKKVQAALG